MLSHSRTLTLGLGHQHVKTDRKVLRETRGMQMKLGDTRFPKRDGGNRAYRSTPCASMLATGRHIRGRRAYRLVADSATSSSTSYGADTCADGFMVVVIKVILVVALRLRLPLLVVVVVVAVTAAMVDSVGGVGVGGDDGGGGGEFCCRIAVVVPIVIVAVTVVVDVVVVLNVVVDVVVVVVVIVLVAAAAATVWVVVVVGVVVDMVVKMMVFDGCGCDGLVVVVVVWQIVRHTMY
eukprot:5406716-Pleurochrysis_carterae.AAC.4